jgi:hypothetical protein
MQYVQMQLRFDDDDDDDDDAITRTVHCTV